MVIAMGLWKGSGQVHSELMKTSDMTYSSGSHSLKMSLKWWSFF